MFGDVFQKVDGRDLGWLVFNSRDVQCPDDGNLGVADLFDDANAEIPHGLT